MEVYENEVDSLSHQNINQTRINRDKSKILCNHCKRTSSNGIRCLGICVADNDY